jgi:hypothetical protein
MDSFTIKPRVGVQKFTPRDPRQAAPTELPASKVVAAVDNGDAEQREKPHDHAPPDVIVDPEARNVINRENDIRNQADREHPDQALLRLRAYRPAAAAARPESDPPAPSEPHANIKA